jgi:purine-binding chemotaxis protein CheW
MKDLLALHLLVNNIHMCVDLNYVNSVLPLVWLEPVPNAPIYIVGLLNRAGKSLPVLDLTLRLELKRTKHYSLNTSIVICSYADQQMGLLVDYIIGLVNINPNNLQMRADLEQKNSYFTASTPIDAQLALLINMPQVLTIQLIAQAPL